MIWKQRLLTVLRKEKKVVSDVRIFENSEFGEIRTVIVNDEPMFCLADVCRALGIKNVSDCKNRLNEAGVVTNEVGVQTGVKADGTPAIQKVKMNFINEPNLYKTIFQSRKEGAERFTDWVTSEVLPSIRQYGMYATENTIDKMLENPDFGIELLTRYKKEKERSHELQQKNEVLNTENALLAQQNLEWADRPMINAIVRAYAISVDGGFREAWVDFKKELLYQHGINLNARITNHMNNTGKKTKPKTLDMLDDTELSKALSVAVSLCKHNDVDISEIVNKKAS